MTQAVQIFNNPEFGDVRIVDNNGEVFFVGRDAATALSYSNPNDALAKHVPDKYKRVSRIATPGGEQNMTLINEAGLYKLVMRSKLPSAERFSDWVCEEVLPSIRKTGLYINPAAPINPDLLIKLGNDMKQLQAERDAALTKVAELTPPAEYCEKVLKSKEHLTSELIAKEYGENAHWLHETLINYDVLYMRRRGKRCYYYMKAPYDKGGYRDSETVTLERGRTVVSHYWTQKGRHFVYHVLKRHGILPLTERDDGMQNLLEAPK